MHPLIAEAIGQLKIIAELSPSIWISKNQLQMKEAEQKFFRTQRRSLVLGEKTHLVGILQLNARFFF